MTTNKELWELAEGAAHWSGSLAHVWSSDPDFNDAWTVGTIDEDGNKYPVIEVDADQYDAPGDSERLARFFTAANPATVLALLDAYETLQAECEKLRSKTRISLGVGDGDGSLFVHGDYDSIKRVQALIFECEKLRKDAEKRRRPNGSSD